MHTYGAENLIRLYQGSLNGFHLPGQARREEIDMPKVNFYLLSFFSSLPADKSPVSRTTVCLCLTS